MLNNALSICNAFAKTLTFPLIKFMSNPIDLKTLLRDIPVQKISGPKINPLINHLAIHSQFVQPQGLFFAIKGTKYDGNTYIDQAIAKGAQVIVTEKSLPRLHNIIQVQVKNIREVVSLISNKFYDNPDKKIRLIGITGTSGKTTTSWLLRHIYQTALKEPTGLLGSLHYDLGKRILPASRTTPDALSLNSYLDEMVSEHKSNAVLEVSSHAIKQKRTSSISFETVAFTNLSLEHMDYHKTIEAYFQTKKELFLQSGVKNIVINKDDPYGQRLLSEIDSSKNIVTIGIEKTATLQAKDIKINLNGTEFIVNTPKGEYRVKTPLLGLFNVYNCLTALGICYAQGYDISSIIPSLTSFSYVPGRMETVPNALGIKIFVDFAHKPEALKNVLQTLRTLTSGKLKVVFGCGGDRDRTKRPVLAHFAETLADEVWATSDNPRTESQEQIFNDMRVGITLKNKVSFINDRAEAICTALQHCQPGDCLLIAGKGHEQYQEIGTQFFPFDDRKVVEIFNDTHLNK